MVNQNKLEKSEMPRGLWVPLKGIDTDIDGIISTHKFVDNASYLTKGSDPTQQKYDWQSDGKLVFGEALQLTNNDPTRIKYMRAYIRDGTKLVDEGRVFQTVGLWVPRI